MTNKRGVLLASFLKTESEDEVQAEVEFIVNNTDITNLKSNELIFSPVPNDQRPINQYIELRNLFIFSSPACSTVYIMKLLTYAKSATHSHLAVVVPGSPGQVCDLTCAMAECPKNMKELLEGGEPMLQRVRDAIAADKALAAAVKEVDKVAKRSAKGGGGSKAVATKAFKRNDIICAFPGTLWRKAEYLSTYGFYAQLEIDKYAHEFRFGGTKYLLDPLSNKTGNKALK